MADRNLVGQVAIVTGAASGIGRASALALAESGAHVVAADMAASDATVDEIRTRGGEAVSTICDIAEDSDVENMVAFAVETFGHIDLLHANAGLGHGQAPLAAIDPAAWRRTIAVNLTGTWLCLRAGIRQMVSQGHGGAIVVTSSATGLTGYPGVGGYAATKAALVSLTKTAAVEYATAGIRVNAVAPGPIATDMVRRAVEENPGLAAHLQTSVPMGRLGTVDEVAAAVVWLCTPAASYITGTVISIDGGQVAG
jgi:NAD(P)-dependent dehydrogenase (short-subunit alcohol dehydrogenase family)